MTAPKTPDSVPAFSIQMIEAFVYEASVVRRGRTADDPAEPTLEAGPRAANRVEDQPRFNVLIGASISFPFGDGLAAVAELSFSVLGVFQYTGELDKELFRVFPQREGLIMLWPYLRATAAQLGSMTGLPLPALPTLDVMATLSAANQAVPANGAKKSPARRKPKLEKAAP